MKNAFALIHPDRRARLALQSRCASGATFLPRPKPAVRAPVAEPEQLPPSLPPEQLLAKCPTQLLVFQLLDNTAAAGTPLPAGDIMARRAGCPLRGVVAAMKALSDKGLIFIERRTSGEYIRIQIIGSGKWVST